jgi:hypothetical protein
MDRITVYPEKRIRFCKVTSQFVGESSVAVFHGHKLLGAGKIQDKGFDTEREAREYLEAAVSENSVLRWLPSIA